MELDQSDVNALLRGFSLEQMERYECYRRSNISKPALKKLFQSVSGGVILNPNGLIILCSIIKMYVGEVIETSRQIMEEKGESDLEEIKMFHVLKAIEKLERKNMLLRRKRCPRFKRGYLH